LLRIERYRAAVENLGKLLSNRDQLSEARTLVRELLDGHGIVLRDGGRVGARFPMAGLLPLAAENSSKFNCLEFGSGGVIWAVPGVPQSARVK
jgi:hypothetical protein